MEIDISGTGTSTTRLQLFSSPSYPPPPSPILPSLAVRPPLSNSEPLASETKVLGTSPENLFLDFEGLSVSRLDPNDFFLDLVYTMGDALAVYGHNNPQQVNDFITWYNLNPTDIVYLVDSPTGNAYEVRTVYQILLQHLDLFGRPAKKFYQYLLEAAQDPVPSFGSDPKSSLFFAFLPRAVHLSTTSPGYLEG